MEEPVQSEAAPVAEEVVMKEEEEAAKEPAPAAEVCLFSLWSLELNRVVVLEVKVSREEMNFLCLSIDSSRISHSSSMSIETNSRMLFS